MKTDLTVSRPSGRKGEALNVDAVLAEQRRAIGQRVMDECMGCWDPRRHNRPGRRPHAGRYREVVLHRGEVLANAGFRQCCVMALGGYGRRELAPHSDINIMFLFRPGAAMISTRLDQACDVFYVTDQAGKKLQDHVWLERVRTGVKQAIEKFLDAKAA